MKTCTKLPESHKGKMLACIELDQSRVLSRLIRIASAILALVMFVIGYLIYPVEALLEMENTFVHLTALLLGMMAVSLVHELVRGLMMRLFSGVKPIIRYAGSYPIAASEVYFGRSVQQIINIVPPVLTIAMLLVLLFTTTAMSWKWIIWLILTVAVCSSVADVYVIVRMLYLPEDILTQNVGRTYLIYSATVPDDAEEN